MQLITTKSYTQNLSLKGGPFKQLIVIKIIQ